MGLGLAAGAAMLALPAVLFVAFLDRLIFLPSPGVDVAPDRMGVSVEEVWLTTEDDVRIHAFWLPREDAEPALLFLHGNAGNASQRLPNAVALQRLGANVLLLDYRGYGRSEGTPSEAGVYADARAGLAWLAARGFADERIFVFGRSLGGGVAVQVARDRELGGVILESTFASISDLVNRIFAVPLGVLMSGRFASDRAIPSLRAPVLFFHGDRDRTVPIESGRRLFELAPEPKRFEVLRGAGHNDTVPVGGRAYFEQIRAFLERPGE